MRFQYLRGVSIFGHRIFRIYAVCISYLLRNLTWRLQQVPRFILPSLHLLFIRNTPLTTNKKEFMKKSQWKVEGHEKPLHLNQHSLNLYTTTRSHFPLVHPLQNWSSKVWDLTFVNHNTTPEPMKRHVVWEMYNFLLCVGHSETCCWIHIRI